MGLRLIIGTSLYVHKSVATKNETTNHELRRPIPPYFCPYLIESSALLHLYHRYYPHPWCHRKIFVWYVEMLPKYTAECPTIKNNTNNNAVTIASLFLYHRTLGIYPSLSSYWEAPSIAANNRIMSNVHHRLPPTTVSCRTNVELYSMQRSSVLTVMVARRWYINRFPRGRSYCMHRNATRSCCTSCYYVANWREQRPREGSVEGYMLYP